MGGLTYSLKIIVMKRYVCVFYVKLQYFVKYKNNTKFMVKKKFKKILRNSLKSVETRPINSN